jgi:hypothetical protein
MQIIGWIIVVWLAGSILTSLSVAFRAAGMMGTGYLGRMIIIQVVKGGIVYAIIKAITR